MANKPQEVRQKPAVKLYGQQIPVHFTWADNHLKNRETIGPQEAIQSFLRAVNHVANQGRRTKSGLASRELMKDKKIPLDSIFLDPRVKPHLGVIEGLFKSPVHLPMPMSRRKRAVLSKIASIIKGRARRPLPRRR